MLRKSKCAWVGENSVYGSQNYGLKNFRIDVSHVSACMRVGLKLIECYIFIIRSVRFVFSAGEMRFAHKVYVYIQAVWPTNNAPFFSFSQKINGEHAHGKRELNIGTPHCFVDDVYASMYTVQWQRTQHSHFLSFHTLIHSMRSARAPAHGPNRKHSICESERNMLQMHALYCIQLLSSCNVHIEFDYFTREPMWMRDLTIAWKFTTLAAAAVIVVVVAGAGATIAWMHSLHFVTHPIISYTQKRLNWYGVRGPIGE